MQLKWLLEVVELLLGLILDDSHENGDITVVARLEGAGMGVGMILEFSFLFFLLTLMPDLCPRNQRSKGVNYTHRSVVC